MLPSAAEVRSLNEATGHYRAKDEDYPVPLILPSMGLVVKYGTNVTLAELEGQLLVYEQLQGVVPVPEVFAWTEDGGQGFLYMDLVDGDTLQSRFRRMSVAEREVICAELKTMVNAWRGLSQPEPYVGE
jgi:hypothetical protein